MKALLGERSQEIASDRYSARPRPLAFSPPCTPLEPRLRKWREDGSEAWRAAALDAPRACAVTLRLQLALMEFLARRLTALTMQLGLGVSWESHLADSLFGTTAHQMENKLDLLAFCEVLALCPSVTPHNPL